MSELKNKSVGGEAVKNRASRRPLQVTFGLLALFAAFSAGAFYAYKAKNRPPGAHTRTDGSPVIKAPALEHHHGMNVGANPRGGEPRGDAQQPPGPAPAGMVWVGGGAFRMGCADCEMPDALPVHPVSVDGFWMDETPVTNAQFEQFVRATNYVTVAERRPDPKDYPGAPPEALVPGSAVFMPPGGGESEAPLNNFLRWWHYVPGADWRHPEGPLSTTTGREDHPVVQVAWEDAAAYARWAGKRLPTEAEFEFAARGGFDGRRYAWGDELKPEGRWPANIWQGRFPAENSAEDGYLRTSPVKAFAPNAYGLYDVAGNVWQWCADWYRPDYFAELAARGVVAHNPAGPPESYDPEEPGVPKRVQKSGSFLCSDQYCSRYQVGSRGRGAPDSGSSNVGFRCVKSAAESQGATLTSPKKFVDLDSARRDRYVANISPSRRMSERPVEKFRRAKF